MMKRVFYVCVSVGLAVSALTLPRSFDEWVFDAAPVGKPTGPPASVADHFPSDSDSAMYAGEFATNDGVFGTEPSEAEMGVVGNPADSSAEEEDRLGKVSAVVPLTHLHHEPGSSFGPTSFPRWRVLALGNMFFVSLSLLSSATVALFVSPVSSTRRRGGATETPQPGLGRLDREERRRMRHRALNFILAKVLFVGVVVEPVFVEVAVWAAWFGFLCWLVIHLGLVRDRLHKATNSESSATVVAELRRGGELPFRGQLEARFPTTPSEWLRTKQFWWWFVWCARRRVRLLTLLVGITVANAVLILQSFRVFGEAGAAIMFLLTFECVAMLVDSIEALVKSSVHFADLAFNAAIIAGSEQDDDDVRGDAGDGRSELDVFVWEAKEAVVFYTEFIASIAILLISFGHYAQVLYLNGLGFSFLDAVLLMQMRTVFGKLQSRIRQYREYRTVRGQYAEIQARFKTIKTPADLRELVDRTANDTCSICLMPFALGCSVLPCGHAFHFGCIDAWLRARHNRRQPGRGSMRCPYCSFDLVQNAPLSRADVRDTPRAGQGPAPGANNDAPDQNVLFEFNGRQYSRFLPNFRLQYRTDRARRVRTERPTDEQVQALRASIDQVQEVFPQAPDLVVAAALLANQQRPDLVLEMIVENQIDFGMFADAVDTGSGAALEGNEGRARDDQEVSSETAHERGQKESEITPPSSPRGASERTRVGPSGSSAARAPSAASETFGASEFGSSAEARSKSLRDRQQAMRERARQAFLARKQAEQKTE